MASRALQESVRRPLRRGQGAPRKRGGARRGPALRAALSLAGDWPAAATQWRPHALHVPDRPPTSIFFRFLASRMHTVSFPAVGT